MSIPVIILSAGPRTGTTWLARCLTATKEILVWGEPNFFRGLTDFMCLNKFSYQDDVNGKTNLHYFRKNKENMWMAQLRPFEHDLKRHWFRMMQNLLKESAEKEGFARWGVKEIIWSMQHVQFIREHFPDYRLAFITRNFLDYFKSVIGSGWVMNEFGRNNYIAEWIEQSGLISTMSLDTSKEKIFKYEDLKTNLSSFFEFCEIKSEVPKLDFIGGSSVRQLSKADKDIALPYLPMINMIHSRLDYKQIGPNGIQTKEPEVVVEVPPTPVKVTKTTMIHTPNTSFPLSADNQQDLIRRQFGYLSKKNLVQSQKGKKSTKRIK